MKTLNKLGISPAPWTVEDNASCILPVSIVSGNGIKFATVGSSHADAYLMAAAPELYEALRIILETLDGYGFQPILKGDPLAIAFKCGQEAIRKASGENEVAK